MTDINKMISYIQSMSRHGSISPGFADDLIEQLAQLREEREGAVLVPESEYKILQDAYILQQIRAGNYTIDVDEES